MRDSSDFSALFSMLARVGYAVASILEDGTTESYARYGCGFLDGVWGRDRRGERRRGRGTDLWFLIFVPLSSHFRFEKRGFG
jgi:hypothetical protein